MFFSVGQAVGGRGQLFDGLFRVTSGGIQALMPQELSQPHEIVAVVHEVLMSHRVSETARV
jgi:hypothetical protein